MVRDAKELLKGHGKVSVKKLPRKFTPGSSVKFGKKVHTVTYPLNHK